jgi:hypothetical protein
MTQYAKSEHAQNKIINAPLWPIIYLALVWVFLVRDMGILESLGVPLKVFVLATLATSMAWLYRLIRIQIGFSKRDLFAFLAAFLFLVIVNSHVLLEAIACDELYHAGLSSLSIFGVEKFIERNPSSIGLHWLMDRPMTQVASAVNLSLLVFLSVGIFGWKKIYVWVQKGLLQKDHLQKEGRTVFLFMSLFVAAILVGFLAERLPYRSEIHPPLRLLPLLLSQLLFGFDDLAFRLVGIMALSGLFVFAVRYVTQEDVHPLKSSKIYLVAILVLSLPVIQHMATIVEPSIWAFAGWLMAFFMLSSIFKVKKHNTHDPLVILGVFISLMSLMRQSAMVLWFALAVALIMLRAKPKTWALSLLPVSWFVPYLLFATKNHHLSPASPIDSVMSSITSGKALEVTVNALTGPWAVVFALLVIVVTIKRLPKREPGLVVLLSAIPAFALYFSISDFLWPLSRYHGEWVGALTVIMGLVVLRFVNAAQGRLVLVLSTFLLFYSINTVRHLHVDHGYGVWPERRITTESIFPYRDAFRHLLQQESAGSFTFTAGVPTYGEWYLYLRGFSYSQVQAHRKFQRDWEGLVNASTSGEDLFQRARQLGLKYAVVQYGSKRENQHRAGWHNRAEVLLRQAANGQSGVVLQNRFYGDLEGSIDIFEFRGQL